MTRLANLTWVASVWVITLGAACSGEETPSPDAGSNGGGFCELPLRLCGGECVSVENDPNHCGQCFEVCVDGSFCDRGACSSACSAGLTECGAACADLMTDRGHCGGCNEACPSDRMCIGGGCTCPPGTEDCGGECTDVQTAIRHCGMCNMACELDELCVEGSCACRTGTREMSCTNGTDDDCDDLVDCDDPDCEGATRRCNGACGVGAETCEGGAWSACVGGSGEAEICGDGVDNDCMDGDARNPDSFEPNDDCTQCKLLQPEADPNVTIMASFDSVDDEVDCFRFHADDGVFYQEHIRLTLDEVPDGHDYDLFLYRDQTACQDLDALAFSNGAGNADESIDWGEAFGTDDGGTYFVRVVRFAGHDCETSYRLRVNGLD